MIDLAVRAFALPLRHPFTISRGTVEVQDTVVVQLHEGGCFGYGEATTNPYYGATVESLTRRISAAAPLLRGMAADDLDAVLAAIGSSLGDDTFGRCALDMAAHDLWAKRQDQPLHRLWGLDPAAGPASNYTIGIDTPERMVQKLAEVPEWPAERVEKLPHHVRELFKSPNTRKVEIDGPNRPANMRTEAPGINPSRWEG